MRFDILSPGNSWVQATITNHNLVLDKLNNDIKAFPPYSDYCVDQQYSGQYEYQITPPYYPGITNYKWEATDCYATVINFNFSCYPSTIYSSSATIQISGWSYHEVKVWAKNSCGESPDPTHIYWFQNSRSSAPSVYPNPVYDILTVDLSIGGNNAQGRTAPNYDVRLYDGQGNMVRQQFAKGGTVQFNVSNLPDGIYYLHIYDGVNSTPEMRQIVVQHSTIKREDEQSLSIVAGFFHFACKTVKL